ncbi:MAG TPA: serine/threonine-protein kinase, partial [Phycisphaerae bacterium]|nr:serine/threonine-protein kinase [Phycisphaerae bacterium]
MTPAERHRRAMEIFDALCDLTMAERGAVLAEECAGDAELRRKVEAMLDQDGAADPIVAAAESGRMVAELVADEELSATPPAPMPEHIGPYRITRRIGEGGMGIIYEAEQESPRRRVAVKVLRPGTIDRSMLKRFQHEAHVLGQLQHAGIAHIHEAGLADLPQGRQPYFVMEFIDGAPLDRHAGQHQLTVPERLELIARVADAVQHAHQKGIIHRDLKPSNVLVVQHAAGATTARPHTSSATGTITATIGQPKILDFGIARVIDAEQQVVTVQTEVGQVVGTLAYMSPEQVAGRSDDLDTRCDVYALGVMLYELLAGRRPHDLAGLSITEAARVVREVEPARLGAIDRTLRGDIETIVAKAMDKDRERRYATAAEFAADIRRYLSDQPIEARPASTFYQVRKFAKRNKGLVGGLAATLAALVFGLISTGYFLADARTQRNRAMAANEEAQKEKQLALAARDEADSVAHFQSTQLSDIEVPQMGDQLRTTLLAAVPAERRPALETALADVNFTDLSLAMLKQGIFERSIHAIDEQFSDQPLLQARLLVTIASTLQELGLLDLAGDPLQRAMDIRRKELGDEDADTLAAISRWGGLLVAQGRLSEAEPFLREAYATGLRVLGPDHPDHRLWANNLCTLLFALKQYDETERILQALLASQQQHQPPDESSIAETRVNLGAMLLKQDKYAEAEPHLRYAYDAMRRLHGPENPATLSAENNLAVLLRGQGKLEESAATYRDLLATQRRVLGDDHPDVRERHGPRHGRPRGPALPEPRARVLPREGRRGADR